MARPALDAKKSIAKTGAKPAAGLRTKSDKTRKAIPASRPPLTAAALVHRLHELLDTMQVLQREEEVLCSLMHEVRRTGKVNAAASRDLRETLQRLPLATLREGVSTLRQSL